MPPVITVPQSHSHPSSNKGSGGKLTHYAQHIHPAHLPITRNASTLHTSASEFPSHDFNSSYKDLLTLALKTMTHSDVF